VQCVGLTPLTPMHGNGSIPIDRESRHAGVQGNIQEDQVGREIRDGPYSILKLLKEMNLWTKVRRCIILHSSSP